jgi:hypothetical protein
MSEAKSASHTPPRLSSSLILLNASRTWKLLVSIGRIGDGPAELDGSADKESADDRVGIDGLVNRLMSCFAPVLVFDGRGR